MLRCSLPVLSDNSRFCPSELTAKHMQQSPKELYRLVDDQLWETQTPSKTSRLWEAS